MQKITQKHLLELLKAAGVPAVEVVTDEDYDKHVKDKPENEADVDAMLASIDESRGKILRPDIEKEITESIDKKLQGTMWNSLRSALGREFKSAGITLSDLQDKTKVEDMVKVCLEKYNEKFSQDTDGLRKELTTQQEAWQQEKEKLIAEEEKKRSELHGKFIEKDIDSKMLELVAALPRDPKGNDAIRAKSAKAFLREIAHLHYDEATGTLELRSKDDTNIPYMGTDGKKRAIEPKDALKDYAAAMGWGATDMRHVNPSEAMKQGIPDAPAKKIDTSKDPVTASVQDAASWGLPPTGA